MTIRVDPHQGCEAWAWVVEDLLRKERFTDVQITGGGKIHTGGADIGATFGNDVVTKIVTGAPFVAIAGTHIGCNQLWAQPGINSYFALQLADSKLLKKTPGQIVADGFDFGVFRQMQKELTA